MSPSTTAIALTGSSEASRKAPGITPRKPTESWICRSVGTARAGVGSGGGGATARPLRPETGSSSAVTGTGLTSGI